MNDQTKRVAFTGLVLVLLGALNAIGVAAPDEAEAPLKRRAQEFYSHLQSGQMAPAENYVMPEYRESFRYSRPMRFLAYKMTSCRLDASGKVGFVTMELTVIMPFSATPVTMPYRTQWRRADGTWYLELNRSAQQMAGKAGPGGMGGDYRTVPEVLQFEQATSAMGSVQEGNKISARIYFTNIANHAVRVTEIYTACDCLTARTDKGTYKPGEKGQLSVEFNSQGYSLEYAQTIRIKTDPGEVVNRVTVTAQVEKRSPAGPATSSGAKAVER